MQRAFLGSAVVEGATRSTARYGMLRYGMAWYGMVWHDIAMAWQDKR